MTEYVCPECGKKYKTQRGYNNHMNDKHFEPDTSSVEEDQRYLNKPVIVESPEEAGSPPTEATPVELSDAEIQRIIEQRLKLGDPVLGYMQQGIAGLVAQINQLKAQPPAPEINQFEAFIQRNQWVQKVIEDLAGAGSAALRSFAGAGEEDTFYKDIAKRLKEKQDQKLMQQVEAVTDMLSSEPEEKKNE